MAIKWLIIDMKDGNFIHFIHIISHGTEKDSQEGLKMESSKQKETVKAKNQPEKNLRGRLKKDGTDMGNGRERSKRETFMEEKE